MRKFAAVFGAFAVSVVCMSAAQAAGGLDPGFGDGGKVVTALGSSAWATDVALDSQGKIVVVGEARVNNRTNFALARYHADGRLDQSFGAGGKVTTALPWYDEDGGYLFEERATSVALQADGKIVVAGSALFVRDRLADSQFAVARYLVDGSLDPSFGNGGVVITDVQDRDELRDVVIQPDGKIVAAGVSDASWEECGTAPDGETDCWTVHNEDFAVVRYDTDGSHDHSFSGGAQAVLTDFGSESDSATALALGAGGAIVVGGYVGNPPKFGVARYASNGTLDASFGAGGKATAQVGVYSYSILTGLAVDSNGKVIAAGFADSYAFALARFTADGNLDPSFGVGGKVAGESDGGQIADVALDAEGRIVVAGTLDGGVDTDFVLARYATDGSVDSAFGTNGRATISFGTDWGQDRPNGIAVQGDGKLVAAGGTPAAASNDYQFALIRYDPAAGEFVDANLDGVADNIGGATAGSFTDGTGTTGAITANPAGLPLMVKDAAATTDGVEISVGGSSGQVTFLVCGGFTIKLNAGTTATVTCGSVRVAVDAGQAEIVLGDGVTTVTVPAGGDAKVTDTGGGTYSVYVDGGSAPVILTVDGRSATIYAGTTRATATWRFIGFSHPVDNEGVLNVTKAGRSVPVRWRLLDANNAPVTNLVKATITVSSLSCSTGTTSDQIEELAAGNSGLLNLGNGHYQLNWATPSSYAGSCKTMRLDVGDGVYHEARFKFTK